jgi:hypothetical protein
MPGCNDSLVIAIKSKAAEIFLTTTMLLIYILERNYLNKVSHFSKLCYHTSCHCAELSVATVAPTSQTSASAMLLLLVGDYKA